MHNVNQRNYATVSEAAAAQSPKVEATEAEAKEGACEPVVYDGDTVEFHVSNLDKDEASASSKLLALGLSGQAAHAIVIIGLANDPDSAVQFAVTVNGGDKCQVNKEWVLAHIDSLTSYIISDPAALMLVRLVGGGLS